MKCLKAGWPLSRCSDVINHEPRSPWSGPRRAPRGFTALASLHSLRHPPHHAVRVGDFTQLLHVCIAALFLVGPGAPKLMIPHILLWRELRCDLSTEMNSSAEWLGEDISVEFSGARLGDGRRTKRLQRIASMASSS